MQYSSLVNTKDIPSISLSHLEKLCKKPTLPPFSLSLLNNENQFRTQTTVRCSMLG